MTDNNAALSRLLMLASSNLPIGSYTYSQGVEPAIEAGLISDEASMLAFMSDYLTLALYDYELPVLALIITALQDDNQPLALALSADYHASRETKEFVFESSQLALSLSSWLDEVLQLEVTEEILKYGLLPLFAHICAYWQISTQQSMTTYAFAQIENMVLAAVKTVPLGQMAGQRIIWALQKSLGEHVDSLAQSIHSSYQQQKSAYANLHPSLPASEQLIELYERLHVSANIPNLAILSCQHERQYSRLFRS